MTSAWVFEACGLGLGLLLGSFLNVCIVRVPRGESVVRPRSRCLECGAGIRWYDNIPLLSWAVLRGRCRDCGRGISWRYPAVEAAVGLWFLLVCGQVRAQYSRLHDFGGWAFDSRDAWLAVAGINVAILGFLLIGLMVMDWQTLRLPDAFTFTGIAVAFLLVCVRAFFLGPNEAQVVLNSTHQLRLRSPGSFASQGNIFLTGPEHLLGVWLVSAVGAATILLVVRGVYKLLRKREGMGLGDVKLLAMIAAFLGFWPAVVALVAGLLLATGYAVIQLGRGKAGAATPLPFGSFLCGGGLLAALFGNRLIEAYRALLP